MKVTEGRLKSAGEVGGNEEHSFPCLAQCRVKKYCLVLIQKKKKNSVLFQAIKLIIRRERETTCHDWRVHEPQRESRRDATNIPHTATETRCSQINKLKDEKER